MMSTVRKKAIAIVAIVAGTAFYVYVYAAGILHV